MRGLKIRLWNTILLLAIVLGPGIPGSARAADLLVLSSAQEFAIPLRPYIKVYEDRTGRFDLARIRELEEGNPGIFQSPDIKTRTPSPNSTWWLHTTIANRANQTQHLVLAAGPPNLERVDFYVQGTGDVLHTRAGTQTAILEQQDLSRFPTLTLEISRGEAVQIWVKIKSDSPFHLSPVLYTQRVFRAASATTTGFDGILIGAAGALAWCMVLLAIVLRRMPFLWLAAIAADACLREAAAREYLQRLLWPLDTTWGYSLELSSNIVYVLLCAMFIRSIARRDAMPIRGVTIYTGVTAGLLGCLLLAMLMPPHAALLSLPYATGIYQTVAGILAACLLVSAIMLARSARPILPNPAAHRLFSISALLALSAIFIAADAALRTTGPVLTIPLIPVSFILESGSSPLALLALAGNLTVLTLLAARQSHGRRLRMTTASRPAAAPSPATPSPAAPSPAAPSPAAPSPAAPSPPALAAPPVATVAASGPYQSATVTATDRQALILGYIGHDLRAPLAIISGYIRLLRQAATPAQHAYLDVIERSVGHQFSLIEEILAYSKTELEPFTLRPEEIDLPPLLEELAHFGIALCADQHNRFQYVPAPTLPARAALDAGRLRQAVLNLLANAAKFTTNGKVRFEARVLRGDNGRADLHLGIFNDGPHISLQDQDQIFLAFRQLHRREAGVGLGLFIVERIAHVMGGTIRVESAPKRGNRFSLAVPIRIVDPDAVTTQPISRIPSRDTHVPQLEAPPLAVRLTLSRLARNGELTEIENWVNEIRGAYPQYTHFYDEITKCVETFDMERLQRLALQGVI